MNSRQLAKLGVPDDVIKIAINAVQQAASSSSLSNRQIQQTMKSIVERPNDYVQHTHFGTLARALVQQQQILPQDPITYRTWGKEEIDEAAHSQMRKACELPAATAAALMPDAHIGYGLPIGGVLACDQVVIPYAVGVDIACRMKLSVLDTPPKSLKTKSEQYHSSLQRGTKFGVGSHWSRPKQHSVMDQDWTVTKITREKKDRAWQQLGTSGSGNHFAEFGILELPTDDRELGLEAGRYVALMSHSGSRGVGAAVCSTYNHIACAQLPKRYLRFRYLAWLELASQAGQEYWAAMNLMGDYAAANHDVIHQSVTQLLGAQIISGVENHHNFAWKEIHGDREVIVHRKGATPAGHGTLGVIPGSMADPAFIVRGRGNAQSLNSAAHGAGRRMSRKKAKQRYRWNSVRQELLNKGVHVLSAGADEVPGVYKNIEQVMARQTDLVETIARFDPKIVKMCDDGSKPED